MDVDIKWFLPAVLPFVVLGGLRALCFVAGAAWTEPGMAAIASAAIGISFGMLAVTSMDENGVKLIVRIGRVK